MLPDNNILDIIISLVLIYALLSILVSILTEWINLQLKTRARFLKETILKLLNDPINLNFGELFYNHYLIRKFYNEDLKSLPQYISSKLFAEVLIDVIADRTKHDVPITLIGKSELTGKQYQALEQKQYTDIFERFKAGLATLKPSPVTDTLHSFVEKSGNIDEFRQNISFWFDDYMDRVSGWFKSNQRKKFYIVGFLVAVGLNVDSLHLVRILSIDDNLRVSLVSTAGKVADNYQSLSDTAKTSSSALISVFNSSLSDSLKNDSTSRIKSAADLLRERREVKKILQFNDSLSTAYMHKADSVLGIASSLNIPIGWDRSSAPLSWRPFDKNKTKVHQGKGLYAYTERRNTFSWGNLLYYLLGISISTVMLSFGAPFWFDTMVKLVNIRRAGKKPEAVNTTK